MAENTIEKEDIKGFIDVIKSVTVQINYRDNKFLLKTKSYKHYISDKKEAKIGKPKTSFSFADVLCELSVKVRADTEKEYKDSKILDALQANDDLLDIIPDAKEQIAAAFIPFVDEVQGELSFIIENKDMRYVQGQGGYLYIPKKTKGMSYGTKLVYRDNLGVVKSVDADGKESMILPPDDVYSFETLPNLLQTISNITVEYCKAMDVKKPIKGTRGQVTPYFIRQACALICYTLLYFGDSLSTYFYQKPLKNNTGVCTQIMRDLHVRTKVLGYEYFQKENKLFEYNKWSMLPEVMLREFSYLAPVSPITYAGHKSGYLGYMIQCLVEQRAFKKYLEPFGGSGIGIAQFPKQDGVDYYISDANYANQCFYKILKAPAKQFNEFLDKLKEVQNELIKIYKKYDALDLSDTYYKREIGGRVKKGFVPDEETLLISKEWSKIWHKKEKDKYKVFSFDIYKNYRNPEAERPFFEKNSYILKLLFDVKAIYRPFYALYMTLGDKLFDIDFIDNYMKDSNLSEVDLAVAFVVLHKSLLNSVQISIDQTLAWDGRPRFLKLNIDKDFIALREAYKKINIPREAVYGADAMGLLKLPKYNKSNVFAYLDSPYICTMNYAAGFPKECMEELINNCKNFQGDFAFSCRINLPSKTVEKLRGRTSKVSRKTIAGTNLYNFIWFMKQWLDTDYRVLFKVADDYVDGAKEMEIKEYHELLSSELGKTPNGYLVYNYLIRCINEPIDLELMICNFNFKTPDYEKFIELYFNSYKPSKKVEKDGFFMQMPMCELAKLVIEQYSKFCN